MRPLCKTCNERPRAVNYKKGKKVYYRSQCESCLTKGPNHGIPRWKRAGYKKKNVCDKCGYKSQHKGVFKVFHVDGNLNNCRPSNLKTLCSNCAVILSTTETTWKQGDLLPDF